MGLIESVPQSCRRNTVDSDHLENLSNLTSLNNSFCLLGCLCYFFTMLIHHSWPFMKTDAKVTLLSLIVNKFSFYVKWTNKLCCILLVINLNNYILCCVIFLPISSHFILSFFMLFLAVHLQSLGSSNFFFNFLCTFAMYIWSQFRPLGMTKLVWLPFFFVVNSSTLSFFFLNAQSFFIVSDRKKILKDPPPLIQPPPLNSWLWKIYIKPWLLDLTLSLSFGGVLSWKHLPRFWGFCCLSLMALLARKMRVCALLLENLMFYAGLTRSLEVRKSAQYQGSLLVKETVQSHLCLEIIFAVRQSYKMNKATLFC